MNIPHFRTTIRKILQEIVEVPNENGDGYTAFQLFKEAVVKKNDEGNWIVAFDAHDKALPLMFDFKKNYFTYELWNALRLKSSNQIRMYEILKQYEKLGKRELTVIELRALLGINKGEYERWERFRTRVLDSCQQALKENTDIYFTYEKGRSGRGGAWLSIIFHIYKNTEYADQLTLSDFIDLQAVSSDETDITDNTQVTSSETEPEIKVIENNVIDVKVDDIKPSTTKIVKTTAKTVLKTEKNENTVLIEQIAAEVDERIDYEGMRKLIEVLGGEYEDEKLEILGTIRNIIIQVMAGYMPVHVKRKEIPKEYAKEIFSQIDIKDVSSVISKFFDYPVDVAMPQVLLATMLFNEVSSRGTQNAGLVRDRNEFARVSDTANSPSFDLEALFEHEKNSTPKL